MIIIAFVILLVFVFLAYSQIKKIAERKKEKEKSLYRIKNFMKE